jgi:hypothetical protein
MQNAAFGAAGLDWSYELLDVPPAELADAMATVRSKVSAGANVTVPPQTSSDGTPDRIEAGGPARARREHDQPRR